MASMVTQQRTKVLVFDLCPQLGLGKDVQGLLESRLHGKLQIACCPFDGLDTSHAPKAFTSALNRFSPRNTFVVLEPKQIPVASSLYKSFWQSAQEETSLTAVFNTASHLEVAPLLEAGIHDVVFPPLREVDVLSRVTGGIKGPAANASPLQKQKEMLGLHYFVGESKVLLKEILQIPAIAKCDSTVLIVGESGTGKEICARAVHELSARGNQPFVAVNCANLPSDLFENELFGHEAGAFTGAQAFKKGVVLEADKGTIFLDEIDAVPLSAQVKLLRFLQNRTFRPLGASKTSRVDLRIIAACNGRLEEAINQQKFRADLFYRINVLRISMPPLRERGDDVILLAKYFLSQFARKLGNSIKDFTPSARHKLMAYHWPGNVRELENVIERASVLAMGNNIQAQDILLSKDKKALQPYSYEQLQARLGEVERMFVQALVSNHHGNISEASQEFGKDRREIYRLMKKYGIVPPR